MKNLALEIKTMTTKTQLKRDLAMMTVFAVVLGLLSVYCAFEILDLRDQLAAVSGGAL
jgi:hypothetical protein